MTAQDYKGEKPASSSVLGPDQDTTFNGHAVDADDALRALESYADGEIELDEATRKRLLRRIDLFMMPIFCIVYGLNYLDKTTLSYASVMGLNKDIGLVGDDYQWLGSVFYFGYLAWEVPAARLLQRLPIAKYNAFCIILWGLTLSCFAAVQNYSGAIALRFFLGVLEASVTPGFALMTSQWYTKSEQASRIGIWISFNGFAQIFGGAVAYGIARGNDIHGFSMASWKIVFLLTGLLTIVMGTIFLLFIPDNQLNAKWLSSRDKILAIERVRVNQQGIGNRHFKMYQLREALTDPATWAFFVLAVAGDITNGGLSNFFSQLIVSFGFTDEQSLLYGSPAGAVEAVALIAWALLSQRYGNRLLFSLGGVIASLVGAILIVAAPFEMRIARLIGYYLTLASVTGFVAVLSLVSSNIAGYTKKTTVGAIYLVGYCIGNIIGPQTFRPQDAPHYVSAEITIIVMFGVVLLDLLFIYLYFHRQNRKKTEARSEPDYKTLPNQEWLDLTDKENPEFIYSL